MKAPITKSQVIAKIVKANPDASISQIAAKVIKKGYLTCYNSEVVRVRKTVNVAK